MQLSFREESRKILDYLLILEHIMSSRAYMQQVSSGVAAVMNAIKEEIDLRMTLYLVEGITRVVVQQKREDQGKRYEDCYSELDAITSTAAGSSSLPTRSCARPLPVRQTTQRHLCLLGRLTGR